MYKFAVFCQQSTNGHGESKKMFEWRATIYISNERHS